MHEQTGETPLWPCGETPFPVFYAERPTVEAGIAGDVTIPVDLQSAVASRHVSFLTGRLCAREVLIAAGALDRSVGRDAAGIPLWPEGFFGSITHTDGLAGAVVAPADACRGIGLDFEVPMDASAANEIADLVFAGGERARLAASGLGRALATTLVFSLKEALYKAIHAEAGPETGFADAEVAELSDGRAVLKLRRGLSPSLKEGREIAGLFRIDGDLVRTLVWFDR